ncbi:MAG: nucleoside deaminase [Candidatus Nanopelagicales bacterium]
MTRSHTPHDAVHRRSVLLGGSVLVAATALAGCASSTSSTQCLTGELADVAVFPSIVREGLDSAMRQAIGVAPEGFPFGAVLVDIVSGEVVAAAGNQMANGDPSAHAEVDVLREAGIAGIDLTATVLVTTAESCVMCAACAVWAGVQGVVYGTPVTFLTDSGWKQFGLTQPEIVSASWLSMPVVGNYLRELTDPLYASGPPR